MQDHDQRSHARPAPLPQRRRWTRPDVPRPDAPRRPAPLPSPDPIVPELERLDPLTDHDLVALLPHPARTDLARAALAGTGGGAL